MDLEEGALPETISARDATGGPAQVTRRPYSSEDGGSLKMELPKLESPHHDNGGPLKPQMAFPSKCGSAAEMSKIGKRNA